MQISIRLWCTWTKPRSRNSQAPHLLNLAGHRLDGDLAQPAAAVVGAPLQASYRASGANGDIAADAVRIQSLENVLATMPGIGRECVGAIGAGVALGGYTVGDGRLGKV